MSLEQCAFNDADFRCPDERGWCPVKLPITQALPLGSVLETDIPRRIVGPLQEKFGTTIVS